MILCDARVGSNDLRDLIRHLGRPCEFATGNQQADAEFYGNGPAGALVRVGIERKNVADLIASIETGRLSGTQLPRMHEQYDIIYLIVEGATRRIWDGDQAGLLEWCSPTRPWQQPRRAMNWFAVENYLTTIEAKAGVNLRQSFGPRDTAARIVGLYDWWTGKEYDQHRSHLAVYKPGLDKGETLSEAVAIVRMLTGLRCRVSEKIARAAADKFRTPFKMVSATEQDWRELDGVGKGLASKLVKIFKGE